VNLAEATDLEVRTDLGTATDLNEDPDLGAVEDMDGEPDLTEVNDLDPDLDDLSGLEDEADGEEAIGDIDLEASEAESDEADETEDAAAPAEQPEGEPAPAAAVTVGVVAVGLTVTTVTTSEENEDEAFVYGDDDEDLPAAQVAVATDSIVSWRSVSGLTGKACAPSHSSAWWCECSSRPSRAPIAYVQSASGRLAVFAGSRWRSEPAAELRGFMNVARPCAARSSFSRAKAAIGR